MKTSWKVAAGTGATALIAVFAGWLTPNDSPLKTAQAASQRAPELVGKSWLNTEKPISLASRRGKVTIVEFWTFGCSNCRANLPIYAKWAKKFAADGVEVIGVHTPEFDHERDPQNVAAKVKELNISYPVLLDGKNENWNRWKQKFWPAIYVLDGEGAVREKWEGELGQNEAAFTAKIEKLVQETKNKPKKMEKITKTDAQWREILSPEAFNVLRKAGTERAFSGDYKPKGDGVYRCAGCDLELFDADTKFDSGTGWPSFYQPANKSAVEEHTDTQFGMKRVEVVCARCDGHLGHVFDDGPKPTGLRYCMNSVSLKFEPEKK